MKLIFFFKFSRFKAEFLDERSICFTKEILSKEKADEILSKKIDWTKLSKDYDNTENPEFSKNRVEIPNEEIKISEPDQKQEVPVKIEEEEEFKANEIFIEAAHDIVLDRFKKM